MPGMNGFFVRIDPAISEGVKAVAARAGLSITKTSEAIFAIALGRDHIYARQIKTALAKHKADPE